MMNGGGMGGGVPRVQMPGGPGAQGGAPGAMGGAGMPPMGGGMPGGAPGGMPPAQGGGDPQFRQMLHQRVNSLSEQEGMALVEVLAGAPEAAMVLKKILPELGDAIDVIMQGGGGGAPGGAPPPPMGGGMGGGMGGMGGGGMPPPPGPSTRLGSI